MSDTDEIFRRTQSHSYPSITILRVLASLGVVSLHCVGLILPSETPKFSIDWWVLNVVSHAFSWVVTVFVMASGAVLLRRKSEPMKVWYTRRFVRVGIPTLIWLVFYGIYFHTNRGDSLHLDAIIQRLIYGPIGHLHFMITISGLYVIVPILNSISHQLTQRQFFGLSLIFIYIALWTPTPVTVFQYPILHIGVFLLGSYLISSTYRPPVWASVLYLIEGSLILTLLESYQSETLMYFLSSIYRLSAAVLIFLLAKNHTFIEIVYKRIPEITVLSTASFGIYLIHPLIIAELFKALKENTAIQHSNWWISLILIPLTYCISFAIVWLLQRHKILKVVVGG